MIMRGSRNFSQGGPGQSDKVFFIPQLILQKSIIFKVPEKVQHFPGGSNFLPGGGGGGGGVQLLIPY